MRCTGALLTEVVYATEGRKKIIPLTMQRRFEPHGWLKFHMSDKLRLDFSSDDVFDDSMKKLLRRLRTIFAKTTACEFVVVVHRQRKYADDFLLNFFYNIVPWLILMTVRDGHASCDNSDPQQVSFVCKREQLGLKIKHTEIRMLSWLQSLFFTFGKTALR